jgi:hypothetical protein
MVLRAPPTSPLPVLVPQARAGAPRHRATAAVWAAAVAIAAGVSGAAPAARAGYELVHESVMPNPATLQPMTATVRSWHEGKRFKREAPMRNEVIIIDLDKREVVGLNPGARTYWKLPAERYRELAMVSLIVMGIKPQPDGSIVVPDPLFLATGQTSTIEGRKAYQVQVQGDMPPGVTTEVWLSKDLPLTTKKVVDQLRLALGDPKHPSFQSLFRQWEALAGYPIQNVTTVVTPRGTIVSSETLISLTEKKIDAKEFEIPKGFTLTEDPITQMERMMAQGQVPAGIGAPLKSGPRTQQPGALPAPDPAR